jgi:hypothetical protein
MKVEQPQYKKSTETRHFRDSKLLFSCSKNETAELVLVLSRNAFNKSAINRSLHDNAQKGKKIHGEGVEPTPAAWQAAMIPFHQPCLDAQNAVVYIIFASTLERSSSLALQCFGFFRNSGRHLRLVQSLNWLDKALCD